MKLATLALFQSVLILVLVVVASGVLSAAYRAFTLHEWRLAALGLILSYMCLALLWEAVAWALGNRKGIRKGRRSNE